MPKEVRQISFGSGEIATALTEYHRRRNLPLPSGNILRVLIEAAPAVRATLFVQNDKAGLSEIAVGSEVLAASLILYCINRRIPLPAESEKRLQRLGDETVALFVIRHDR